MILIFSCLGQNETSVGNEAYANFRFSGPKHRGILDLVGGTLCVFKYIRVSDLIFFCKLVDSYTESLTKRWLTAKMCLSQ
jgi:hypothetical protein